MQHHASASASILGCRGSTRLFEPFEKLSDNHAGEPSATIRARVEAARGRQRERFADSERLVCNGDMGPAEIREYCVLDEAGRGLLRAAMQQLYLSARA